eukprot:7865649-Pyramimonas_sp.AAC.1
MHEVDEVPGESQLVNHIGGQGQNLGAASAHAAVGRPQDAEGTPPQAEVMHQGVPESPAAPMAVPGPAPLAVEDQAHRLEGLRGVDPLVDLSLIHI